MGAITEVIIHSLEKCLHSVTLVIAEIEEDGNFTITKHPNTGGLVSVGTVTAQLLYETSSPAYINPDVIANFDTLKSNKNPTIEFMSVVAKEAALQTNIRFVLI